MSHTAPTPSEIQQAIEHGAVPPLRVVIPGTFRYVTERGERTVAFIVKVSPSFTVTYRRVVRKVSYRGVVSFSWTNSRAGMVHVSDEMPNAKAVAAAIELAGCRP